MPKIRVIIHLQLPNGLKSERVLIFPEIQPLRQATKSSCIPKISPTASGT